MTNTYTPIASVTLSDFAASVTFGNLPTTGFRDLVVIMNGGTRSSVANFHVTFNGDSTSSYSWVRMKTNPIGSQQSTSSTVIELLQIDQNPNMAHIQIFDYTDTTKQKTVLASNLAQFQANKHVAARYGKTDAITSVTLTSSIAGREWRAGTTFTIHGIAG